MSHEIEILEDGTASFFSAREIPWHNLGQITDSALTAEEALSEARLNWVVTLEEMQATVLKGDGVSTIAVPDKFATVRTRIDGTSDVLGVVGNRYTVMQNADAFAFCNNIVDEGGAHFETAGSLYGGRRVFLSMKLPNDILVGGHDLVENYLLITNSHDGSSPVTAAITPVRAVCKNTVGAAMSAAKSVFKVRHSASIDGRLQEAREALDISWKYAQNFGDLAEKMYEDEFSKLEFANYVHQLWERPEAEDKKASTIWDNRYETLTGLWSAPTQENIAGTKWAAYNTVIEYLDWFSPTRGNEDKDERRAERIIDGSMQNIKNNALRVLVGS